MSAAAAATGVRRAFIGLPRSSNAARRAWQIDRLAPPRASPHTGLQRKVAEQLERGFGALAQGLRGEPHRRVDGAEAVIAAPVHDLEKEPPVERAGIGVEELARADAVVE